MGRDIEPSGDGLPLRRDTNKLNFTIQINDY